MAKKRKDVQAKTPKPKKYRDKQRLYGIIMQNPNKMKNFKGF